LAWSAVQLVRVESQSAVEAHYFGDQFGEFSNGLVLTTSYIDQRSGCFACHQRIKGLLTEIHEKKTCMGQVITVKEFPPRRSGSPEHYLFLAAHFCFMHFVDERGDNVRRL